MIRILLLCTFCLTLFQQLGATNKYWNGGSSGNWNEANNWSPAGVPTASDEVYLYCDCSVSVSGGYVAQATSVLIYENATVSVADNATLRITPTVNNGLHIVGRLNNWGTVEVGNPNSSVNQGVFLENEGRINNWGQLNVSYAITGILVWGDLISWGEINVNEAAAAQQSHGIYVDAGGYVVLFSNSNVSINHTNNVGFRILLGTSVTNYGDITIETGCTGRGFANAGFFSNRGRIEVSGATTDGFYNSGELFNRGQLIFYGTASGNALNSIGGDVRNLWDGLIYVYGSQYDAGIRFAGIGHSFDNHGRIDVYTGQQTNSCLYFNWGTYLNNYSGAEISVRTQAQNALLYNGDHFQNLGGEVDLQCYGPNKSSLRIGNSCLVTNSNCGTIRMDDRLSMSADAELQNQAWLEIMNGTPPSLYLGAQINNGGVIYDRSGALENVSSTFIYNDEGVIITAPTEAIVFGDPYTDYILAGPYTDVELDPVITNGSFEIGIYDESETAVYFDENTYDDPKYFYAQVNVPGCDNRTYRVYNNTPLPINRPVSGGGNNRAFGGQPGLETSGLEPGTIGVFPNPAKEVLNLQLTAAVQGEIQLELRDLNGRSLLNSRREAASRLTLDRPANLPGGTYLLTVTDPAGKVVTKRVVFQ